MSNPLVADVKSSTTGYSGISLLEWEDSEFPVVAFIGATKGADVDATVKAGRDSSGKAGMLINSSRAIIYASSGEDFAEAASKSAAAVQAQMNLLLK